MKVLKPMSLGLLTRPFEQRRQFKLGVAVLSFVPIGPPALLSEVSMWKFLAEELAEDQAVDAAIPKSHGEVLVVGHACAPAGTTVPALEVSVALGQGRKALHVFGDRHWVGNQPTDPAPFATMPLDWRHAFGGPGHPDNPMGKGIAAVDTVHGQRVPLPNVVPAGSSAARHRQTAGFGPVDQTWPQRARLAGTHDDRWLNEDFPGFARDLDWRFFNIAPSDQHFAGPFRGDEAYAFGNMHPDEPLLAGQLPSVMARAFVVRRGAETLEEVPLRLTTVWCFPHRRRLVLVHHGVADLAEEDGADVSRILVGADPLGQPRDSALFAAVMQKRMDRERGAIHALRDSDLVPGALIVPDPALEAEMAVGRTEGLHQKHARRRVEREIAAKRAYVASFGLDPDEHGPTLPPEEAPPSLDELPDRMERLLAEGERQMAEMKASRAEADKAIEALLPSTGLTMDQLRAERETLPSGPPEFTAAGKRRELEGVARAAAALGADASDVDGILADPEVEALWRTAEAGLQDGYRQSAHLQGPAPPRDAARRSAMRDALASPSRRSGQSWARADLTGLDLSGMDLSGMDLEGAWLDGSDLSGCNLRGARLQGAVLAHANLSGADLAGANLHGANLGRACLRGAVLRRAILSGAVLDHADLQDAVLHGANLSQATMAGVALGGADLAGADMAGLALMSFALPGLRAPGARLDQAKFLEGDLAGADMAGATLGAAMFLKVSAPGLNASLAQLRKACFVEACNLAGASFAGADLTGANLRGTLLPGANLDGAILHDADLSGCDLQNARMGGVRARGARFVAANLSGAVLAGADLMHASLARADLRGADLTGASIYEADVARVLLDRNPRVGGMLTTRARTRPRAQA